MTKRLGRGLADLIDVAMPQQQGSPSLILLKTEQIRPGRFQPRTTFNEAALEELKASIKRSGVIEPIIVRPVAHGIYEVVAGERRLRAARALGLAEVPALIKTLSDKEALEMALIENVQREHLNPIEEAGGYSRLLQEFGYTQEEIAAAVGKDRATVANTLRLLTLPEEIQRGLREGRVSAGHAKALLGVMDRSRQLELYARVVKLGLSVRETERLVSASPAKRRRARHDDPELKTLEDELCRALGTRVRLAARRKGGRIVIEYFSSEELTRILQRLGVAS